MKPLQCFLFLVLCVQICSAASAFAGSSDKPFLQSELLFPLEHWHNHSSCIVECPNGDLLVCWYHGSGERTADDVVVLGARKKKNEKQWSAPFLMADTPGYPDTNPAMFIDPQKRLWLLWPTILAHRWESALMKYCISSDYEKAGPPHWNFSSVMHITPGTNFQIAVNAWLDELAATRRTTEILPLNESANKKRASPEENRPTVLPLPSKTAGGGAEQPTNPASSLFVSDDRIEYWITREHERANDELSRRLGWMTRVHPVVLDGHRVLVPLYSDGFNFSLVAITDDWGNSWYASGPLLGIGNIQPSLVRKRDGTLVAFMRHNGPPPHRVQLSQSTDRGLTWSRAVDSEVPNPGAGVEAIVLKNGLWLLIYNDQERKRHSLAVSLSDDEGKTWKWTRHLERDNDADIKGGSGSYHYPSIIQSRDGTLHASYSFSEKTSETKLDPSGQPATQSIKHAHFNEAWIRERD